MLVTLRRRVAANIWGVVSRRASFTRYPKLIDGGCRHNKLLAQRACWCKQCGVQQQCALVEVCQIVVCTSIARFKDSELKRDGSVYTAAAKGVPNGGGVSEQDGVCVCRKLYLRLKVYKHAIVNEFKINWELFYAT